MKKPIAMRRLYLDIEELVGLIEKCQSLANSVSVDISPYEDEFEPDDDFRRALGRVGVSLDELRMTVADAETLVANVAKRYPAPIPEHGVVLQRASEVQWRDPDDAHPPNPGH